MFDKQMLKEQLKALGAPQNGVVLVHTSLRAVGAVEGGGQTVLDALVEWFTADGGLLCIPTHTWKNLGTPEKLTLDLLSTETCIGTLPSIAAGDPRGVRTAHPTHSMVVFGDEVRVREFIADEETRITPGDPRGCYGKLYTWGGHVLLLGVGHDKNTYLHSVEEMLDVPNRLSKAPRAVTVRHKTGEIEHRFTHSHSAVGIRDVSAHYPKYEPAFRHHGAIRDGVFGNAKTQLCDARRMHDVLALVRERSQGAELLSDLEPLDERLYL